MAWVYLNIASSDFNALSRTGSAIVTIWEASGAFRDAKISSRPLDFIYLHIVQLPTRSLSGNSDCKRDDRPHSVNIKNWRAVLFLI